MRLENIKKRPAARAMLSMMLGLALVLTMMPQSAFAATYDSAYYKEKMDEAEAKVNTYTQLVKEDEVALSAAEKARDDAQSKVEPAKTEMESAEMALNVKSRAFMDTKIIEAWNGGDKATFASDADSQNTVSKSGGKITNENVYQRYLSDKIAASARNSSTYSDIVTAFEEKYGEGSFDDSYTYALGYFNELRALDLIDECNAIRADKDELANYWTNVKDVEVPADIPQLRISPYMMTGAAMSSTINSCVIRIKDGGPGVPGASSSYDPSIAHIYFSSGLGIPVKPGQIAQGYETSDDSASASLPNPFGELWTRENSIGASSHNATIASEGHNATGAAIIEPNPYKAKAVFSMDFGTWSSDKWKSYTTAEYRSGLKSYCSSELATYNKKSKAYEDAVSAYATAKQEYNDASAKYTEDSKQLSLARSSYNNFKTLYENRLASEQSSTYYKVKFVDGLDNTIIKETSVKYGCSAATPDAPAHDGYTFTGWDSTAYQNVTADATVTALYTKASSDSGSVSTYYTVTFVDSIDHKYITRTVKEGGNAKPPTPQTHDGYTFIGWDSTAYNNVTSDVTITALFEKTDTDTPESIVTVKKPALKKIVTKQTTAKVTVKAVEGCAYQYQIRKKGTSKWSSKKSSKTTLTLKKLKKNKKYQVRVRAYKKVSGKTYYSKWRTVTVKTTKKGSKTYKY